MNRQPSRNTANVDAIECLVNTNDLAQEIEAHTQKYEPKRESNSSRRDQPSKRSNENSNQRSNRHSPPSVTRKRPSSPPSNSATRSHHQHQHYPSQKHHRPLSPSPSHHPQSSSRHRQPAATARKRSHSKSRSPYDRRTHTHRSRPESSKERTMDEALASLASSQEPTRSKRVTPKHETADLSLISEDESAKTHHIRSNGGATNESPSVPTNNKLHSTPSVPVLQPNPNETSLDMSNISQDYELSLFAKSALSNSNLILPTTVTPSNDCMQTIDLIAKYKMMQAMPHNSPQIEACSNEVLTLIQRQIALQKSELNYREREIKLRERELAEREKRFNDKPNDMTNTNSITNEPFLGIRSTSIEEKPQINIDQDKQNISSGESDTKSILSTGDASKINSTNKQNANQPTSTRKTTRFSQLIVDPTIFASQEKPVIGLYSDDHNDNQSSSTLNTDNSLKKTTISKILAPSESTMSLLDTDLKVTSSNSCRKVEIQSGNIDKTIASKGSSHDLRLTLSKNRTKQQNNDNDLDHHTNGSDEEIRSIPSKINSTKDDDKQQSHEYQQQRSITSTSIETVIDNNSDKRDNRRQQQQRNNGNRQQQYSSQNSSSSMNNSDERTYTHGSTSKYNSNERRHETGDLRSRLFDNKHPKSSRTTHRNNY